MYGDELENFFSTFQSKLSFEMMSKIRTSTNYQILPSFSISLNMFLNNMAMVTLPVIGT